VCKHRWAANECARLRAAGGSAPPARERAARGSEAGAAGPRYIADFLAPSDKLIVEVDGGYHACREQADAPRDRQLGKLGYRVLHLPSQLVQGNMAGAIALVRAALGH